MKKGFFEFSEICLCGANDGRINVASTNTRKGVITYQREDTPAPAPKVSESFYASPQKKRMGVTGRFKDNRHHKGEDRQRIENLKTLSDSKRQRLNRAFLRQLKMIGFVESPEPRNAWMFM